MQNLFEWVCLWWQYIRVQIKLFFRRGLWLCKKILYSNRSDLQLVSILRQNYEKVREQAHLQFTPKIRLSNEEMHRYCLHNSEKSNQLDSLQFCNLRTILRLEKGNWKVSERLSWGDSVLLVINKELRILSDHPSLFQLINIKMSRLWKWQIRRKQKSMRESCGPDR